VIEVVSSATGKVVMEREEGWRCGNCGSELGHWRGRCVSCHALEGEQFVPHWMDEEDWQLGLLCHWDERLIGQARRRRRRKKSRGAI